MQRRFGQDFSGVQVHTDPSAAGSARALSARAYTIGEHVFFGAGEYAPATGRGRRLLTHELTHVVQQRTHPEVAGRIQRKPASEPDTDQPERPASVRPLVPGALSDEDLDALGEKLKDPDLRRYEAAVRLTDARRRLQEAESNATRHVRLMRFRSVMAQKHYLPETVRDYMDEYLTMVDLQVLKKFGFEFPSNILTRYKIRTRVIDAIDRYDADWQAGHAGESEAQGENQQIDEFQAIVDADTARARAAYDPEVAEAIAGGIFGAIGYGIAGNEGAKAGAALDGMLMGFGGMAEAKSSMPTAEPVQRDPMAEVRPASGEPAPVPDPPVTAAPEPLGDKPAATEHSVTEAPVTEPAASEPSTPTPAAKRTRTRKAPRNPGAPSAAPKPRKTPRAGQPPKAPKRTKYDDDLDTRIAKRRADRDSAAKKTLEYQDARREQDRSLRGGPAKGMWTIEEDLSVLERARAHPERLVLEQVRLVGVKTPGGTLITSERIAGEGRTLDFIEVAGNKVLGGEVKSPNEIVTSVEDLYGADMQGTFREKSKVGGQRAKENAVVRAARRLGGTLVFKGKDIRTGAPVTLAVSPRDYRSTVVSYDQIVPN